MAKPEQKSVARKSVVEEAVMTKTIVVVPKSEGTGCSNTARNFALVT